jgi:hypothetical protein
MPRCTRFLRELTDAAEANVAAVSATGSLKSLCDAAVEHGLELLDAQQEALSLLGPNRRSNPGGSRARPMIRALAAGGRDPRCSASWHGRHWILRRAGIDSMLGSMGFVPTLCAC